MISLRCSQIKRVYAHLIISPLLKFFNLLWYSLHMKLVLVLTIILIFTSCFSDNIIVWSIWVIIYIFQRIFINHRAFVRSRPHDIEDGYYPKSIGDLASKKPYEVIQSYVRCKHITTRSFLRKYYTVIDQTPTSQKYKWYNDDPIIRY